MNYPFADAVLDFVRFANGDSFFNSVMSIVENYPPQVLSVLMNHIGTHDTERAITDTTELGSLGIILFQNSII